MLCSLPGKKTRYKKHSSINWTVLLYYLNARYKNGVCIFQATNNDDCSLLQTLLPIILYKSKRDSSAALGAWRSVLLEDQHPCKFPLNKSRLTALTRWCHTATHCDCFAVLTTSSGGIWCWLNSLIGQVAHQRHYTTVSLWAQCCRALFSFVCSHGIEDKREWISTSFVDCLTITLPRKIRTNWAGFIDR